MLNNIYNTINRMIDNFAFKCKIGANADTPEEGLRFPVHLQELTDKAEWKSSVMKVRIASHSRCPNSNFHASQ